MPDDINVPDEPEHKKTQKGGTMDEENTFDPEAFKKEISNMISEVANKAVSGHLARVVPKLTEEIQSALGGTIAEQIKELKPDPSEKEDPEQSNATAALKKQVEELQAQAKQAAEQSAREREQRLRSEEMALIESTLVAQGVPAPLARAATGQLHESVKRTSDGSIRYVRKDTGPAGPFTEEIEVSDGIKGWLSTEEGKHFLPATPAKGSGNRGGGAPDPAGGTQGDDRSFIAALIGGGEF